MICSISVISENIEMHVKIITLQHSATNDNLSKLTSISVSANVIFVLLNLSSSFQFHSVLLIIENITFITWLQQCGATVSFIHNRRNLFNTNCVLNRLDLMPLKLGPRFSLLQYVQVGNSSLDQSLWLNANNSTLQFRK